jgi:hypothetical protein
LVNGLLVNLFIIEVWFSLFFYKIFSPHILEYHNWNLANTKNQFKKQCIKHLNILILNKISFFGISFFLKINIPKYPTFKIKHQNIHLFPSWILFYFIFKKEFILFLFLKRVQWILVFKFKSGVSRFFFSYIPKKIIYHIVK